MLRINTVTVVRGDKQVLTALSLQVAPGEIVVLRGPNGAGKSSLALALLGHPTCRVTTGSMELDDINLLSLKTHERARLGLFLAHQEPPAIPGVSVTDGLRAASDALRPQPFTTAAFFDKLRTSLAELGLSQDFADRNLHESFSGGEKKRAELLSLLVLEPKYAVLDELDSGMDSEARSLAVQVIHKLQSQGVGFLVISHQTEFIQALKPTAEVSLA